MDRAPCTVRNMKDTKRRNSILILPDVLKKNNKKEEQGSKNTEPGKLGV